MKLRGRIRKVTLCCLFGFLLCHLAGVEALRAADLVAARIYESVMSSHPRYKQVLGPKALAGCFDWQKSTPDKPVVKYLAVATPLRGSRGTTSVGRLASNTLDRCQRAQQKSETGCECQVIDRNTSNVLEPPEDFVRRFK